MKPIKLPLDALFAHPAAFRRLCVETSGGIYAACRIGTSRLQAAVC